MRIDQTHTALKKRRTNMRFLGRREQRIDARRSGQRRNNRTNENIQKSRIKVNLPVPSLKTARGQIQMGGHPNESKTLGKGLRLLQFAAAARRPLGVTDLAIKTHINKSTVFRLLRTLQKFHFVDQDLDGRYALSYGLFELVQDHFQGNDLVQVALEPLRQLQLKIPETVNLAVQRGDDRCIYLLSVPSPKSISRRASPVGASELLHCSALGKALLAFSGPGVLGKLLALPLKRFTSKTICEPAALRRELELVRRHGWSADLEESEPETRCVGAPIIGADGMATAAISVSMPAYRLPDSRLSSTGKLVMQAANLASERLAKLKWGASVS